MSQQNGRSLFGTKETQVLINSTMRDLSSESRRFPQLGAGQLRTKYQTFEKVSSYSRSISLNYRSTWETYVSAWKTASATQKQATLEASASPDCVYRDPLASTTGYEALVNYMLGFHQQVPGGYFETT